MTKIPTREEFEALVSEAPSAGQAFGMLRHWGSGMAIVDRRLAKSRAALLAAYDEMIERIVELEAQCDTMGTMLLEEGCDGVVHECAVLEARIKELEENDHV